MEEIKAKYQGGSGAFPRTDSTHSDPTCFLFTRKIHFCQHMASFCIFFAIEFRSADLF